jgi:hypothetical protein
MPRELQNPPSNTKPDISMTEPSQSSLSPSESRSSYWATFLAIVGCFLIFAIVLYLAYIPQRRAAPEVDLSKISPEEQWKYTADGRQTHLDELRAKEQAAATSYAWIDRDKGIVQLPLDRAMQLTLVELNGSRKH